MVSPIEPSLHFLNPFLILSQISLSNASFAIQRAELERILIYSADLIAFLFISKFLWIASLY